MSSTVIRVTAATLLVIALGSAATANDKAKCLPDLVNVVGWSAKSYGAQNGLVARETEISIGLRNAGATDIVMLQGTVTFVDALGSVVAPFPLPLDPDITIPAAGPGNISRVSHHGSSRLVDIDKSMVTPAICVTAAALADGSVLRAEE